MKLAALIDILNEALSLNGDMDVVGIVDGTVYNEIEINCPDEASPMYVELYKEATFTAYLYDRGDLQSSLDFCMFDDKEEAIDFAKSNGWDEIVNDATGKYVWKKDWFE